MKAQAGRDSDEMVSGFYAIKSRMNAERLIRQRLIEYRKSRDSAAATAASYADKTFALFYAWDSAAEASLRRIAAFKSSVGEMQELRADQKVHADESLKLLIAVAGELLDDTLILEGPDTRVTKRRMTLSQRDQIVGEIERAFAGHLAVEEDGLWHSGWAATAATIRDNLLDKGWKYSP